MDLIAEGQGALLSPVPRIDQVQADCGRYKSLEQKSKVMSAREAIRRYVADGDYVISELTGNVRGPMALIREIVRQKLRNLRVAGNTSTLDIDLLLAAGCVSAMDLCYVGYELLGTSYLMRRAIEDKTIKITEWSNATMAWRIKAAAMGVPFLPCRSMYDGTDTFRHSAAQIVASPFTGEKICVVPALRADVALIHVHRCDEYGNAQIDGITGSSKDVAASSAKVIISTEKIISNQEIRNYPERTLIPYFLVTAVVEAPFGAHPGNMPYLYDMDVAHYRKYTALSRSPAELAAYLDTYILDLDDDQAYLERIGRDNLAALTAQEAARFTYREESDNAKL